MGNRGDISPRQVEFWISTLKTWVFWAPLYIVEVCVFS